MYYRDYKVNKYENGGETLKSSRDKFEVIISNENEESGKIITPYIPSNRGSGRLNLPNLEVRFKKIKRYNGEKYYNFWEYNFCDFNIYSNNLKDAIELAIKRLIIIFKNGVPSVFNNFIVSGYKLDEKTNKKLPVEIAMENKELNKRGEKWIYLKKGDILEFDVANDDKDGFWYIIDKSTKKRVSNRIKGSNISSYISNGRFLIYK